MGLRMEKRFHFQTVFTCRYNELLISDRVFINPYAVHNMVTSYDINEYSSLLLDLSFPEDQSYQSMRAFQNQKWAEERLKRGKYYSNEGKLNDAIRCFCEAIELVPTYPEAYIERGAAWYSILYLM